MRFFILRSLRRFGRQGECGCKTPRVGHCEAAERRISQNTRRLQAFLPEPETAWLNEEISFGRFCCSCLPVPAGRFFHSGGKHMKKRFLALLLVLTLLVGLMPAALAAGPGRPAPPAAARIRAPVPRIRSARRRVCGLSPPRSRRMTETAHMRTPASRSISPATLPSPARGSRSAARRRMSAISLPVRSMAAATRSAA